MDVNVNVKVYVDCGVTCTAIAYAALQFDKNDVRLVSVITTVHVNV
jgi:hypothetical protein